MVVLSLIAISTAMDQPNLTDEELLQLGIDASLAHLEEPPTTSLKNLFSTQQRTNKEVEFAFDQVLGNKEVKLALNNPCIVDYGKTNEVIRNAKDKYMTTINMKLTAENFIFQAVTEYLKEFSPKVKEEDYNFYDVEDDQESWGSCEDEAWESEENEN